MYVEIPEIARPSLFNTVMPNEASTPASIASLNRIAIPGRAAPVEPPDAGEIPATIGAVVSADKAPFLIGQRVLVKFMKPGEKAGAKRDDAAAAAKPAAGS